MSKIVLQAKNTTLEATTYSVNLNGQNIEELLKKEITKGCKSHEKFIANVYIEIEVLESSIKIDNDFEADENFLDDNEESL